MRHPPPPALPTPRRPTTVLPVPPSRGGACGDGRDASDAAHRWGNGFGESIWFDYVRGVQSLVTSPWEGSNGTTGSAHRHDYVAALAAWLESDGKLWDGFWA